MGLGVAVPGSDVACRNALPVALENVVCHVFHPVVEAFIVERRLRICLIVRWHSSYCPIILSSVARSVWCCVRVMGRGGWIHFVGFDWSVSVSGVVSVSCEFLGLSFMTLER